ncbi:MAG: hypothetical protein M3Z74_00505 [Pseudomonadota bacterium]|nr:hypothetical protein [Pseudomonadota bacterium]
MRTVGWRSVVLVLAPFAACALIYLPTLSGALLSDDYAVLAAVSDWSREGHLLRALLSKFHSGLDSPSFYYRPLSMASFGANFALSGAYPLGWRLTNLALHLVSGALVFAIVRRFSLEDVSEPSNIGPAIAAAVFLLFPTSPEAVAWVSGRYDLLALLFMLATLAFFQRAARWYDALGAAALLTAACALASKESAALLPALVLAVAIARRAAGSQAATISILRIFTLGARDAAPWLVLGIAYFAMRAAIFGNPFQVYAGTSPLNALASGAWMRAMSSAGAWVDATLPLPFARTLFLMAIVALLALGTAVCWRHRASRASWLAVAISALLSIASLLPHVSGFAVNGEQGRLFYTTSALLALLVGLAISATVARSRATSKRGRRGQRAVALGASLVLIVAELLLLRATVAPWGVAGAQARALIVALPGVAGEVPEAGYGFVLVPDHLSSVPFGRNAQGGLMLPPTQALALSSRLIVQTPTDLPAWPADAQRGLVDALRHYPLSQVWSAVASGQAQGTALPTDYFCWAETSERIVRVSLPLTTAQDDWPGGWRSALAGSPCVEVAAELERQ